MNSRALKLFIIAASLTVTGCDSLPSWMGGKKEEKPKLVGERITALPAGNELEPDAALKNTPANLPRPSANSEWPQHAGNVSSAEGNLAADGEFNVITRAAAGHGEGFENALLPAPVVGGGLVFAMDSKGYISAHVASAIESVSWQSKGVSEEDEPDVIGGGLAYEGGVLYVTSGRGVVAALDATTGKENWRKSLHVPFRSAPRVAGGKLFAITVDNQAYALSVKDGNILWSHRGINETAGLMNTISPTVDGDNVIIPYSSGEVYVLSVADGKEVWGDSLTAGKRTQANALFAGIGGDPVVDGGVLFSVGNGGTMTVHAASSGQRIWERPIGSLNTPWLAGDNLFVLSLDNTMMGMVKFDGHTRWATKLQGYEDMEQKKKPITWKGPVMVDSKLAVVGSNGRLLLLSAEDGKILSTIEVAEDIYTAPVVAGGRIYLMAQDATLYCLK